VPLRPPHSLRSLRSLRGLAVGACARQDEVASWMKEGKQIREEKEQRAQADLLNLSIEQLFHVEPSRRGQRRANLFKQRMVPAAHSRSAPRLARRPPPAARCRARGCVCGVASLWLTGSCARGPQAEAAQEDAIRKGKGYQDLWEAARVGNMDEIMNKLFRQKGFEASPKDLRCEMVSCCRSCTFLPVDLRAAHAPHMHGCARTWGGGWEQRGKMTDVGWQPWHPRCSCARS